MAETLLLIRFILENNESADAAARPVLRQLAKLYLERDAPFRVSILDRDRKALLAAAHDLREPIDHDAVERCYILAMSVLCARYDSLMGGRGTSGSEAADSGTTGSFVDADESDVIDLHIVGRAKSEA